MRAHRRSASKASRNEIARTAARLLAEGTAETFAEAKQKAADILGLGDARTLPENIAVHEALIDYQAVFGGDAHRARIEHMRRGALAAMRALAEFEPRLVGPVLYGTACEYSPVTLHLYTDEFEAVTRYLQEQAMPYRLGDTELKIRSRMYETFPSFEVHENDLDFDIVVLPHRLLSNPPLSSLDDRPFRRAGIAALEQILAGSDPAIQRPVCG